MHPLGRLIWTAIVQGETAISVGQLIRFALIEMFAIDRSRVCFVLQMKEDQALRCAAFRLKLSSTPRHIHLKSRLAPPKRQKPSEELQCAWRSWKLESVISGQVVNGGEFGRFQTV